MSLDIWLSEDIEQIIIAAVRANEEALADGFLGSDPLRQRAYHQGFTAALSTMALALGLPQLPPLDDTEQTTIVESSVVVGESWPRLAPVKAVDLDCMLYDAGEEATLGSRSTLVR
jgi:hypothetical protein